MSKKITSGVLVIFSCQKLVSQYAFGNVSQFQSISQTQNWKDIKWLLRLDILTEYWYKTVAKVTQQYNESIVSKM